jgi:RNA polymerase sigma factor (sigma-70 family)
MQPSLPGRVIESLLLRDDAGATDGQLLERYLRQRDERAFAALVHRHAPMVWGVCRRALANDPDAEDAFQATFLVLVRKAKSIRPRELVGNWLHGVARRVALAARRGQAQHRQRERQVAGLPEPAAAERDAQQELHALLDQELCRLPEKYRIAILLCDLAGRTRKDVARQLGIPEGTLSGRLTRGRALLARRLARYGLAVSAAALIQPATAAPATVVAATIRVAMGSAALVPARVTILVEGVLKAMFINKLRLATLVVLAAALLGAAVGAGGWGFATGAGENAGQAGQAPKLAQKKKGEAATPEGQIELSVFPLRKANAADMAKTLQELLQGTDAPGLRIAADPGSNSVVVRGRRDQFEEVEAIIVRLEDAAMVHAELKEKAEAERVRWELRERFAGSPEELDRLLRKDPTRPMAPASPITVTARQGQRERKFSPGISSSLEGLTIPILGTCSVGAAATKDQWNEAFGSDHIHIVYAEQRPIGVETGGVGKTLAVCEIIVPISAQELPAHIYVRTADRYQRFSKYDPREVMLLRERLKGLRP